MDANLVTAQQACTDARSNLLFVANQYRLARTGTDLFKALAVESSIAQQDTEYARAALDRGDYAEALRKADAVSERTGVQAIVNQS